MKKKFKRIFKIALLSTLVAIAVIIIIVLFPKWLFANKLKYRKFTVCSNQKIDTAIKPVLDNAMSLVQTSELYDSSYNYNIILCHNTFYNKIDNTLLGEGPSARATLNNLVIKVRVDSKNNLAFPSFRKACETNLTYLLAHEMIHCLQAGKYGIMKFNPFKHPPFWKLEGYPEYVSRQPELSGKDYSLNTAIDRYVDLEKKATDIWITAGKGGCEAPNYYLKGRLMIEYLMNIRHYTYDQIIKDTSSENSIYQEMLKWNDSTKSISSSISFIR